ncbi:MAG TPA: hypothetical protein VF235_00925 [Actinomycetota bacterium]
MVTTELAPAAGVEQAHEGLRVTKISAAAFAVSGLWYALLAEGVVQSEAPASTAGETVEAGMRSYWSWFATTVAQERIVTGLAIAAFGTLIVSIWAIRERLAASPATAAGALLASLGATAWIVGNVLQLGGHRAVALMATHGNPIETTNSIAFTIDMIDDAFELAAFAMLGVGLLCLASAAQRSVATSAGWTRLTAAVGAVSLGLAVAYAAGSDLVDVLIVALAVVLVPAWLVWAGRAVRPRLA